MFFSATLIEWAGVNGIATIQNIEKADQIVPMILQRGNESIPGFYFHRRYRGSRYVHYRWYSGHHQSVLLPVIFIKRLSIKCDR